MNISMRISEPFSLQYHGSQFNRRLTKKQDIFLNRLKF